MTDDTAAIKRIADERIAELGERIDVLTSKIANLEGRVNYHRDQVQNYRATIETIADLAPQCGWQGGCQAARVVPMCPKCIAKEALGGE